MPITEKEACLLETVHQHP